MKIVSICENHLFGKAYSKGKRQTTPLLTVHLLPDYRAAKLQRAHPQKIKVNRIGLTVSKKIGKATVRSRTRRIMREAYRMICKSYNVKSGFLIVIVAREAIVGKKSTDVYEHLCSAFVKLNLLGEKTQ